MQELTDHTKMRIFEKLDELSKDFAGMSERLARVEEKFESSYRENDAHHNNINASLAEVKNGIEILEKRYEEQQSILDKRAGEHRVYGGVWQIFLAAVGGGALIALGGFLAKFIGIFN